MNTRSLIHHALRTLRADRAMVDRAIVALERAGAIRRPEPANCEISQFGKLTRMLDARPRRRRRRPGHWTRKQTALLREMYPTLPLAEIAAQLGRSLSAIKNRARGLRLRRNAYGRQPWSEAERDILRRRYPDELSSKIAADLGRRVPKVYAQAKKLGLKKSAEFMASDEPWILRRDPSIGASGRFRKGIVPANKGVRRPGWCRGRMSETWFKKGQRNGAAARNWVPIGSTRINADGYLDRKIADTGCPPRDWKGEHRIIWEAAHGPIPPGHFVVFRDRDRRNVTLANLELITRAENMRRNTIHNLPPPVKDAIYGLIALKRTITTKTKKLRGETAA